MQPTKRDDVLLHNLQGAPNFRDIGGYETVSGGSVCRGRLYRSEALTNLTEADLATLESLDIRLVCDLRGMSERKRYPSRWPLRHNTEWLLLDIDADFRSGNEDLRSALINDPTPAGVRQMMLGTYRMFPAASAAGIGKLLRGLVDIGGAVLIHCSAGKDRTGFFCACVLSVLGVSKELIYQDYMLSAKRINIEVAAAANRGLIAEMLGFEPDSSLLAALFGVSPEYLDAAFAAIDEGYGSFDRYLAEAVGLDIPLKKALLERFIC